MVRLIQKLTSGETRWCHQTRMSLQADAPLKCFPTTLMPFGHAGIKEVPCEKLRLFLFSLELNMLCRGTGFQTQFRLNMRRKKFKLCNIFFATLSPSIYNLATRDFSLINRGTEWTGSGRTGLFWSRWPTPCIILTTPGEHNRWLLHLKFYHIGQLQKKLPSHWSRAGLL